MAKKKSVVAKSPEVKVVEKVSEYPEFIVLPYRLAHKLSRSDRRVRMLLRGQVAEHIEGLKKKK